MAHTARAALGVATVAHAGPALSRPVRALRPWIDVLERVGDTGGVALTFDDGPHPQGTPAVLEHLRALGVTATFFLVGEQVLARPALAAEVVAAGHDVALHGHRHRSALRQGPRAVADDLARGAAAIADATGRAPRIYRPPFGIVSGGALLAARRHGWTTQLWTRSGRDLRAGATPRSITADATRRLRGSAVVLLHDADHYGPAGAWRATAASLPGLVDAVRASGLALVTLEWRDPRPAATPAARAIDSAPVPIRAPASAHAA